MNIYGNANPEEPEFAITGTGAALVALAKVFNGLEGSSFLNGKQQPSRLFPDMLFGVKLVCDESVADGIEVEAIGDAVQVTGSKAAFSVIADRILSKFSKDTKAGQFFFVQEIGEGHFVRPAGTSLMFIVLEQLYG